MLFLARNLGAGDLEMWYNLPVFLRRAYITIFNKEQEKLRDQRAREKGELSETMSVKDIERLKIHQKEQLSTESPKKEEPTIFNIPKFSMKGRK